MFGVTIIFLALKTLMFDWTVILQRENYMLVTIRHFRNAKRTGAEMCPAIVSGIVTGDAPVSYWPVWPCPQ